MPPPDVRVGPARRAGPYAVRAIDYPAGFRQPEHCHEAPSLTIVLAGDIRETTRTADAFGSALSVVAKPAGVPHADEVGPQGARTVQVTFLLGADESGGPGRWCWSHGGPAASPLLRLARALRSPTAPDVGCDDLVIDALAAVDGDDGVGGDAPGWLVRAKEALDDRIETGVGIRQLARLADAHPVSVSRAFRRHYGVTVTEYRRRERVRRAAGRIGASRASLSAIGHGTGHADHPHLCREFRRLTGLTPSEFRRLARPV